MDKNLQRQLLMVWVIVTGAASVVSFEETPIRWREEPQVMGCNREFQRYLVTQTNLALEAIDNFKDKYTWHKFKMGWNDTNIILNVNQDLEFLKACDEEEECMKVLPELPSPPHDPPATIFQAKQQMAEALQYFQQYAFALEILFLDQSLHEDDFQSHMDEIYVQMGNLVSAMIWGVNQCQVSPRDTNLRLLMGKVYRGANSGLRDQRGFRTIRQCQLGLQYVRTVFSMDNDHPLLR